MLINNKAKLDNLSEDKRRKWDELVNHPDFARFRLTLDRRLADEHELHSFWPYDDDTAYEAAADGAQAAYEAPAPVLRGVERNEEWGCVGVYENFPHPGRDRTLDRFQKAVEEAGGCVKVRAGSLGPAREEYPHRLLDRPDGNGWTVYYLIALLSAREVRQLVREHLGPLDVPFVEGDADEDDADEPGDDECETA